MAVQQVAAVVVVDHYSRVEETLQVVAASAAVAVPVAQREAPVVIVGLVANPAAGDAAKDQAKQSPFFHVLK